jgi:hypothetical protein
MDISSKQKAIDTLRNQVIENTLNAGMSPIYIPGSNKDFSINTKHDHKSGKGIYAVSRPVKWFDPVIKEADRIINWLNNNNGHFEKPYVTAYAISHCQICDDPSRLFVVAKELVNSLKIKQTRKQNNKNFWFPKQAIFNAEILEAPEKIEANVPKRELTKIDGKVGSKIVHERKLVSNMIDVPDACMSFPNRTSKTTKRFYRIKVKYQTKGIFGILVTHKEWVEGLKSHIFQHECDHAKAINIHYKR